MRASREGVSVRARVERGWGFCAREKKGGWVCAREKEKRGGVGCANLENGL